MSRGVRSTMILFALLSAGLALAPSAFAQEHEDWPEPIHDDMVFWFVIFDNLEWQSAGEEDPVAWEQEGWIGTDWNRIWLKTEGERATDGSGAGEMEAQLVYSRLVSPFWELQAGIRYDRAWGPGPDRSRVHLAFGVQGLAPYWFEVEPTIFVSQDGDLSARIEASYDMLFTQRLILQPEFEINLAAQSVEEWGVGSGLSDASVDLRLRYEIRRELAPYVGVGWSQKYGRTADLARASGEEVASLAWIGGVRFWF